MTGGLKEFLKRHWPALRLRVILFAVLFFVAALPGFSAIFLRVYENTLVRQTQAELAAQGAALVAVAEADWPGETPSTRDSVRGDPDYYRPEGLSLDLSTTPELPERPPAKPAPGPPDPIAEAAAKRLAPIVTQTSRSTLASIVLLDRHGQVIFGPETGGSYADLPEVRAALAGTTQTVLRRIGEYRPVHAFEWLSRASALRIHHARPVMVGDKVVGVILLSRSSRALFRGIYEDRGKILFGVALIFATLVVLTGLVSRGVARPRAGPRARWPPAKGRSPRRRRRRRWRSATSMRISG
jgi:two-component system sensor histidine kinase ChvG